MKILVVGASQGTGALCVKTALANGHSVTAFSRTPAKLDVTHPPLTKVAGDFHDGASVRSAVAGHDALIISVSPTSRSTIKVKPDYYSRGTKFEVLGRGSALIPVAADIRAPDWEERLRLAGFDAERPTLVIAEGLLMYFTLEEVTDLFERLARLLPSADTLVWSNHVSEGLFTLQRDEVRSFLESISRLGEPFLSGFSRTSDVCGPQWDAVTTRSAGAVLGDDDEVTQQYLFSVLRKVS